MYRLSIVLTFFIYSALAFRKDYAEFEELNDWQFDNGSPATSSSDNSKCKKDILLVVDTSYSIGTSAFNKNVKPFLKNLVKDSLLNVRSTGTQIGLIIFSEVAKTKKVFSIGEITDAETLARSIDDALDYSKVGGSLTRTDLGLKKANEMFTKKSPLNRRLQIDDVVILMTDGAPRGRKRDTLEKTKDEAKKLKDNGVLLIVAAVGPDRKKFKSIMEELATSPENVLDADFNNMDNIMNKLIKSSCIKPGKCKCYEASATYKLKVGQSFVTERWPEPKFVCAIGGKPIVESKTVSPDYSPPHSFSFGKHVIKYTYKLKGDVTVECPVTITVKGKLCGGLAYKPKRQVCCCGKVHTKKPGHRCCGNTYYNFSNTKCCTNSFSVLSKGVACPE